MDAPSISDEAVRNATGKTWEAWFDTLKQIGAAELSHQEIAQRLGSEHGVPPWWAQTITVEFERTVGRRELGQKTSGEYAAAGSKTVQGDMDSALEAWQSEVGNDGSFDGIAFAAEPEVSKTEKWRYWRVTLVDGSKVIVNVSDKTGGKALVQVNHEKLSTQDDVERWKAHWKEFLKRMSAKQVPR